MEKLGNNYADCYYLTEDGCIYNARTKRYTKPDKSHRFKLKRNDGTYQTIALKTLYKTVYNKNFCRDDIKDLPNEEWKYIDNTDLMYAISSEARIKSFQGYEAILLKPYSNQRGYQRVDVVIDGHRQVKLVHRLVAAAFLPRPEGIDYQLHHKDLQKASNKASNLVWLSPAQHRAEHKLMDAKKGDTVNAGN